MRSSGNSPVFSFFSSVRLRLIYAPSIFGVRVCVCEDLPLLSLSLAKKNCPRYLPDRWIYQVFFSYRILLFRKTRSTSELPCRNGAVPLKVPSFIRNPAAPRICLVPISAGIRRAVDEVQPHEPAVDHALAVTLALHVRRRGLWASPIRAPVLRRLAVNEDPHQKIHSPGYFRPQLHDRRQGLRDECSRFHLRLR